MFGMSGTELAIVLIVALLLLGPSKLPELARGLGKAVRDFKKATGDIRGTVESEFYRMDQPDPPPVPPGPPPAGQAGTGLPKTLAAEGTVPAAYLPETNDPHATAAPPPPVETTATPGRPGAGLAPNGPPPEVLPPNGPPGEPKG